MGRLLALGGFGRSGLLFLFAALIGLISSSAFRRLLGSVLLGLEEVIIGWVSRFRAILKRVVALLSQLSLLSLDYLLGSLGFVEVWLLLRIGHRVPLLTCGREGLRALAALLRLNALPLSLDVSPTSRS